MLKLTVFDTFTYCAVGLSIPLDEEAGAVPDYHPLQMGRHGEPGQTRPGVIEITEQPLTASF